MTLSLEYMVPNELTPIKEVNLSETHLQTTNSIITHCIIVYE